MNDVVKMKVLAINRYSFPEVLGGAHRYFYEVAKKLADRGHEVHIIYSVDDPNAKMEEEIDGVYKHKFYFRDRGSLINNYNYVNRAYEISKRILEKRGVDIVNFHDGRTPLRLFGSPEFASIPFVYTCQADTAFEYQWDYKKTLETNPPFLQRMKMHLRYPFHFFWQRYCLSKAFERSNGIVVLSDYVRNTIKNNYGDRYLKKIRKIPSGVDVDTFHPPKDDDEKKEIRSQLDIPVDNIVFLTARRMTLRMGWFNLMDAISLLLERNPKLEGKVTFVFIGTGDIFDQVQQYAKNSGIDKSIIFTGSVTEEKLRQYYRASDCFILPTEELEGFGIVSIESFASGIPVIGTPRSAVPEVLRQADPELVTKNHTADGLCEGIEKMIEKIKSGSIDQSYFRDLALKKFSWEIVISQIESFYKELVVSSKAR